jgi:small subunit ribosomal protein S21
MIKVKLRGNETTEQMLKRFKKLCEKEGLTKDMKRLAHYEKPSEKRRRRGSRKPLPIGARTGQGNRAGGPGERSGPGGRGGRGRNGSGGMGMD